MKELTIKEKKFLDWYFAYGQDQEQTELKINLADMIIGQMYEYGFGIISVKNLFDNCNQESIRVYFTCQYEMMTDDYDIELSDLNEDYTITLI